MLASSIATKNERWNSAAAYLGIGSLILLIWGRGPFVLGHARLAFSLHLARLLVAGTGLSLWSLLSTGQGPLTIDEWGMWLRHLASLSITGIPLPPTGSSDVMGLAVAPAVLVWIADLVGLVLALLGQAVPGVTAAEETPRPSIEPGERERLRQLRDQRLEQIRYATTTAASERLRDRRIREARRELGTNLVRLDHLNHLLAIGELSATRYDEMADEVQEEIDALREELSALGARIGPHITNRPPIRGRVATLGSRLQARTLSLSFIDRGGLPLFTYGHFPLDEALIAGMLSAFNSISNEVFGSPINKTHRAEGQVLYFVHGQWSVLMGLFDDEPSPTQISRLQQSLTTFEQANADELQRNPVEPARLTPTGMDTI